MSKFLTSLSIIALSISITACSNGFSKYYNGLDLNYKPDNQYETCTNPKVAPLPNIEPQKLFTSAINDGYIPIGISEWEGPYDEGDAEAAEQAKKIGASLVLWRASYSHTRHGVLATPVYTPGSTSMTTHSGNIFSGGAYGTYSGVSTTYTPGSYSTTYTPYAIDRYNYEAVFFARVRYDPSTLMLRFVDIPIELKRKIDSNNGVLIIGVIKNGPAFNANIFAGDILLKLNDMPITIKNSPLPTITGENKLTIWRDGRIITKSVYLQETAKISSNQSEPKATP